MQIGPRIRVGGSLGKLGQQVKLGVGKAAKIAAPIASFVNPALGAGLAGVGTMLDTSKGAVNPLSIAKNAALSYGVGKIGGKIGDAVGGKLGSMIGSKVPVGKAGGLAGLFKGGGSDGQGNMGLLGDLAGKAGGMATNALTGKGGGDLMDKLLLGGAVAVSAADRARAQKLQDRAGDYATGAYDAKAPLRQQAIAQALSHASPTPLPALPAGGIYDPRRQLGAGAPGGAPPAPSIGARVPASSLRI